jgi:hypothetical protein
MTKRTWGYIFAIVAGIIESIRQSLFGRKGI